MRITSVMDTVPSTSSLEYKAVPMTTAYFQHYMYNITTCMCLYDFAVHTNLRKMIKAAGVQVGPPDKKECMKFGSVQLAYYIILSCSVTFKPGS